MTNLLNMVNEADARLHFTDVFKSLTGREHLDRETIQKRLLLCLYGLGTNTGLKRMAVGNDDVTYKDLLYIRRRFISCDHLRNAITQIVNAILSARQEDIWGKPPRPVPPTRRNLAPGRRISPPSGMPAITVRASSFIGMSKRRRPVSIPNSKPVRHRKWRP